MTRDVPQRRGGVVRDVPRMVRGDCGSSARVAPLPHDSHSISLSQRMVVYKPGTRPAGLQTRYQVQVSRISRWCSHEAFCMREIQIDLGHTLLFFSISSVCVRLREKTPHFW